MISAMQKATYFVGVAATVALHPAASKISVFSPPQRCEGMTCLPSGNSSISLTGLDSMIIIREQQ
jgi:hypothetical protein